MIYYSETHVSSLILCAGFYVIYRKFCKCSAYIMWSKMEPTGEEDRKIYGRGR